MVNIVLYEDDCNLIDLHLTGQNPQWTAQDPTHGKRAPHIICDADSQNHVKSIVQQVAL